MVISSRGFFTIAAKVLCSFRFPPIRMPRHPPFPRTGAPPSTTQTQAGPLNCLYPSPHAAACIRDICRAVPSSTSLGPMEREMCSYLDWQLDVDPTTLRDFQARVQLDFAGPGPYPPMVLPQPAPAPFSHQSTGSSIFAFTPHVPLSKDAPVILSPPIRTYPSPLDNSSVEGIGIVIYHIRFWQSHSMHLDMQNGSKKHGSKKLPTNETADSGVTKVSLLPKGLLLVFVPDPHVL